ncbi:MAG: hypothetical protein IPO85_18675 [Saprospiraceae bacterium]|uniref:Uncharacterized protein n=1 Tax=Candidatus Defluviibacterium haderslevense TaxID=2981993 RepID=A0A9D7SCX8_9BACT|nr:hypothetical protein [Candidatus Defluviibacterium haderslevense]
MNSISKVEDKLQLKAIAFEDSDLNWGRICQGNLEFINSTSEGKKSWKYDFEIPIEFNCLPKQSATLRLIFKYNEKKIIETVSKGYTPAFTQLGIISNQHEMQFINNRSNIISVPIDTSFLEFISIKNRMRHNEYIKTSYNIGLAIWRV